MFHADCMRTTLDLPQELVAEAQHLLGYRSKTDTLIFALRELLRRHRIAQLRALAGGVEVGVDLARSRRRPASSRP